MPDTIDAVPDDIDAAARALLEAACAKDVAIVTAESCTGGLLAALLTDVEGASHAFERGFVAYSEKAKCELLGIEARRIEACGAVSADVAVAMAEGALAHSHGQLAAAITGFAGPGAHGDEPGLVHFATADRAGRTRHAERHFGDIGRGAVRIASLRVALAMLRDGVAALG